MKRVLLSVDVRNWAWDFMARGIQKYAPPNYEVEIVTQDVVVGRKNDPRWLRQWDGILNFSWAESPWWFGMNRLTTLLAHEGAMIPYDPDDSEWLAGGASRSKNLESACNRLPMFDRVIAVNECLARFGEGLNPGTVYLPAGVDTELFAYRPIDVDKGRSLRVGWCGQMARENDRNVKGYKEILKPVIERLSRARIGIEFKLNTATNNTDKVIRHEDMPAWYYDCDVLLCTSMMEGSPMTVFEAASCGRAIVSTNVGEVRWLLGKDSGGGVNVGEYCDAESAAVVVERIVASLELLAKNRDVLAGMGTAASMVAREWYSWERLAAKWLDVVAG